MPEVTISQAAQIVGKGRRTIYDDIAKGRVTAKKDANGVKVIDLSELHRAYGSFINNPEEVRTAPHKANRTTPHNTAQPSENHSESDLAKTLLLITERLEAAERRAEKAEVLLEKVTDTLTALTHRLEHKPEPESIKQVEQPKPEKPKLVRQSGKVASLADILKHMEND